MINLERLKEIRQDRDVTQEELSQILKVDRSTIGKWETSAALPSLENIFNFSKYFNLSIDYVLGLSLKNRKIKYNNYDKKLLASNLKTLRLSKNISQRELSQKLGVTHQAIVRYEKGLSNPSLNILYCYVNIFKISFHKLCTGKIKDA